MSLGRFRRFLHRLVENDYTFRDPLSYDDPAQTSRQLLLTFDDGFRDFYEAAFPVIQPTGVKPLVFVVPGLLGRSNQWDMGTGGRPDLMSAVQLRELQSCGVVFGSHTLSHPYLTRLSDAALGDEIRYFEAAP